MRGPRVGRAPLRARSLTLISSLAIAALHEHTPPLALIGPAAIVTARALTDLDVVTHQWVAVVGEVTS